MNYAYRSEQNKPRERKRNRKTEKNSSSEEERKVPKVRIKLKGPDGKIINESIGEVMIER